MMSKTVLKNFTVNDLEDLQNEFYDRYDPDYWLYKIYLLKNFHDKYDHISECLNYDLPEKLKENYKRMMRTELHFVYFQMIETLFEIIFAITEYNRRELWLALTFSNDRKTAYYSDSYSKIKEFSKGKLENPNFWSTKEIIINEEKVTIPLLRWIFYYKSTNDMSDDDWKINLDNIYSLLRKFAEDFSDRGEYNAYKHSLRFHNSPFKLAIGPKGSKNFRSIGRTNDSIVYLKDKKVKSDVFHIYEVIKPFDSEIDFKSCHVIYSLIYNIINTRKYSLSKEIKDKISLATFLDVTSEDIIHNSFDEYCYPK